MRLLPRNEDLFVHLREHARIGDEAASRLYGSCANAKNERSDAADVGELERQGNEVMRKLTRALRDSFITPLDRNDMHRLGMRQHDLLRTLNSAAWRMCCYGECGLSGSSLALCETLRGMVGGLRKCIDHLAEKKQREAAMEGCASVSESARKVETQLREALTELFASDANAATLVKRKDIYEQLKLATEHCESIAETIVDMLLDE